MWYRFQKKYGPLFSPDFLRLSQLSVQVNTKSNSPSGSSVSCTRITSIYSRITYRFAWSYLGPLRSPPKSINWTWEFDFKTRKYLVSKLDSFDRFKIAATLPAIFKDKTRRISPESFLFTCLDNHIE